MNRVKVKRCRVCSSKLDTKGKCTWVKCPLNKIVKEKQGGKK